MVRRGRLIYERNGFGARLGRTASMTVRFVLAFAALIGGILAGAAVERLAVQLHAWRIVGVRAWAEFSRHADLGYGRVVYPFLGFGQLVLTSAAALMLVGE